MFSGSVPGHLRVRYVTSTHLSGLLANKAALELLAGNPARAGAELKEAAVLPVRIRNQGFV